VDARRLFWRNFVVDFSKAGFFGVVGRLGEYVERVPGWIPHGPAEVPTECPGKTAVKSSENAGCVVLQGSVHLSASRVIRCQALIEWLKDKSEGVVPKFRRG
jgi:hypothetical protein